MDDHVIYGIATLALVVSDLLLVGLGAVIYRLYWQPVKKDDVQEPDSQEDHQEMKALTLSLSMLGERLTRIETQLGRVQQGWEERQPSPAGKENNRQAIRVATKMALQGANVEELVNLCGLTRGEAELIRMLHLAEGQADQADLP